MIPLVPVLLAAGGWFGLKEYRRHKALTPERQAVFQNAMNAADPSVTSTYLRNLATVFAQAGLDKEAKLLTQRAALKDAPPEVKAARRDVFLKAMQSTNPDAILDVARAHEKEGATGAAEQLRAQAEAVRAVKEA